MLDLTICGTVINFILLHFFFVLGLDYLWECILQVPDAIAHKPIELMKDIYTNLSTKLPQEQVCVVFNLLLALLLL